MAPMDEEAAAAELEAAGQGELGSMLNLESEAQKKKRIGGDVTPSAAAGPVEESKQKEVNKTETDPSDKVVSDIAAVEKEPK